MSIIIGLIGILIGSILITGGVLWLMFLSAAIYDFIEERATENLAAFLGHFLPFLMIVIGILLIYGGIYTITEMLLGSRMRLIWILIGWILIIGGVLWFVFLSTAIQDYTIKGYIFSHILPFLMIVIGSSIIYVIYKSIKEGTIYS